MSRPNRIAMIAASVGAAMLIGNAAQSQQPAAPIAPAAAPPPAYGAPITIEQAMKAGAAAREEAKKNNFNMAIAVVDPSGDLVYFEKIDGTQYASGKIAQDKATAAAIFRRSTKTFADRVAANDWGLLTIRGVVASDGGVPIVVGGKIIGAIGVSGGSSAQDGQVSQAGANALK